MALYALPDGRHYVREHREAAGVPERGTGRDAGPLPLLGAGGGEAPRRKRAHGEGPQPAHRPGRLAAEAHLPDDPQARRWEGIRPHRRAGDHPGALRADAAAHQDRPHVGRQGQGKQVHEVDVHLLV